MTIQQLKYLLAVAEKGSISEAAKSVFVSQPCLSSSIRDLENEVKRTLFVRTNRGIHLTNDGKEFLGYARQVLQQMDILAEKYFSGAPPKQRFRVSTQHYTFAANAFVDLVKKFGGSEYEFTLHEAKTHDIIEDVRFLRSEMGIIYLSQYNKTVIGKLLHEYSLDFHPLFTANPHIFLYRKHALATRKTIELNDLDQYPCITFDQGENNSFYFSEEILSARIVKKSIKVSDRAAVVNLLIGLNAYTISTGVFPKYLHGNDIIAVPLNSKEKITVGIIKHKDITPSRLGEIYWDALRKIASQLPQ